MKINVTNILLGLLIAILLWKSFMSDKQEYKPQPITITVPESKGVIRDTIENFERHTVYLPDKGETIDVDSGWKKKYEVAVDSLEKQQLFLEAIKINSYEKTFVDNDTIQIKGFATARGSLLDYSVDWTIKPRAIPIDIDPEVRRPRLQAEYGAGVYLTPNQIYTPIELGLREGRYGVGVRVQYDPFTKTMGATLNKTFTLIK
jgi:hypothetical protein